MDEHIIKTNINNDILKKNIILYFDDKNIYNLDIFKKEKEIQIKFNNTENGSDEVYSCIKTLDNIKSTTQFDDINEFYEFCKKINVNNCNYKKVENYYILKIKIGIKTIELILEEDIKIDINSLEDVKKELMNLKRKNHLLEEKVKSLEEQVILLEEKDKCNQNKMDLNFFYNCLDINAYELDNIFNHLESSIIKTKEDFGLINRGIKFLLNKKIVSLQFKYKSNNEELNLANIKEIFDNLEYFLIVIMTKDRKRFGAFCQNPYNNNDDGINFNNINNNINNNFNLNQNNINNDINQNRNNMNNNFNQNMNNNFNQNMNNNFNQNMNNNFNQNMNNMNNNINKFTKKNFFLSNKNNIFNLNNNNLNNTNNQNNINNNINNNSKPNQNIINNFNQNLNNQINLNNNIFNSSNNLKDYFVFSIDDSKIYYSDLENSKNIPNFSIIYDMNRQCIYGNEINKNNSNDLNQSLHNININQNTFNNSFKLSGKAQFNVNFFELYEILLENK